MNIFVIAQFTNMSQMSSTHLILKAVLYENAMKWECGVLLLRGIYLTPVLVAVVAIIAFIGLRRTIADTLKEHECLIPPNLF